MDDSRFIARMDPALLVRDGEYIDGVFVIDDAAVFPTNPRNSSQGSRITFGNHNNYSRRSDEMNDIMVTMRNRERNFGSRVRGQPFDYRALKKRSHCGNKIEEICSICLSEYVNGDTIGTLHCRHEYHATCIEEWLQRGKKNCPICRSSVLPHTQS
ncbi:hypothetical protein MTR67_044740 [Solanum verrucosum]|uniref:RING-type E3 ubiquitin transferase n=1 Tax=Solanum verrucosum TaxID=315347 RepID=A0AAF0URE5_SOLVR|nr:hypothetical protein MTR67_044740 [Solanum verrucosum]